MQGSEFLTSESELWIEGLCVYGYMGWGVGEGTPQEDSQTLALKMDHDTAIIWP